MSASPKHSANGRRSGKGPVARPAAAAAPAASSSRRGPRVSTILLVLMLVIGLGLLLYPTVAAMWNSHTQTVAVADYDNAVAEMDDGQKQAMLDAAHAYNQAHPANVFGSMTSEDDAAYQSTLNVSDNGMMGYVEVPKINVKLPIYHGTSQEVLQIGAGHLEGTSLPVGGESTHSVISAHRGLPSSTLFTDLDKLQEGDKFNVHVLGQTMTYQVDQIRVVWPDNVSDLQVVPGEDLCTLATCTPYGVNDHRLLVRGHRVPNDDADSLVSSEAMKVDPMAVAGVVTLAALAVILGALAVRNRREKGSDQASGQKK